MIFFGFDNGELARNVVHDMQSNETMRQLAVAYRLDRYVGSFPGKLSFKKPPPTEKTKKKMKDEKFWADIWEAYWGALFLERQLWNDRVDDLLSFLQHFIHLRYQLDQRLLHESLDCP